MNDSSTETFFSVSHCGRVPAISQEAAQPWISPRSIARLQSLPLR